MKALYVLAAALVASLLLASYSLRASQSVDHKVCVQIELLKGSVRSSLERARKSIPTITYYRHHPAEEARALKEIDRQLALFKRRPC